MRNIEDIIMRESRHHFIYGYDTLERKKFCEDLEEKYPILLDNDKQSAVYLEEYGLPNLEVLDNYYERHIVGLASREYLSFLIAYRILLNAKKSIDYSELNKRMERLINIINKNFMNSGFSSISDVDSLLMVLCNSKEFYLNSYKDYVLNGNQININKVSIPFLDLEIFIRAFKEEMNINSSFSIIINNNQDIALSSVKAINDLVGSRINSDISMKIVTEPDKWKSFFNSCGAFVQSVHDYGTIELDDSLSQYIKTLKK